MLKNSLTILMNVQTTRTSTLEYNRLANEAINKWLEFSRIQHAEFLVMDEQSFTRFYVWLKTGNEEDAWS